MEDSTNETYTKKDNLTMTITTSKQKVETKDITLKDLLQQKTNLLGEVQRIDEEYKQNRQVKLDMLTKIENLIKKAEELEIVETEVTQ